MVVGYVFSRKDKKVFPIIRAGPCERNMKDKIYDYFKNIIEQRIKGG